MQFQPVKMFILTPNSKNLLLGLEKKNTQKPEFIDKITW